MFYQQQVAQGVENVKQLGHESIAEFSDALSILIDVADCNHGATRKEMKQIIYKIGEKSYLQRIVLILQKMLVDDAMEPHAKLLQHLSQIFPVNCFFDLCNAHVDVLTHGRAS